MSFGGLSPPEWSGNLQNTVQRAQKLLIMQKPFGGGSGLSPPAWSGDLQSIVQRAQKLLILQKLFGGGSGLSPPACQPFPLPVRA